MFYFQNRRTGPTCLILSAQSVDLVTLLSLLWIVCVTDLHVWGAWWHEACAVCWPGVSGPGHHGLHLPQGGHRHEEPQPVQGQHHHNA